MESNAYYLEMLEIMELSLKALKTLYEINELTNKRKRSCAVRAINRDRKRNGFYQQTFVKMRDIDHEQFFIYTRMSPQIYKLLLNLVSPFLSKTSLREPVQPECRLAVTLLWVISNNCQCNSIHNAFVRFLQDIWRREIHSNRWRGRLNWGKLQWETLFWRLRKLFGAIWWLLMSANRPQKTTNKLRVNSGACGICQTV